MLFTTRQLNLCGAESHLVVDHIHQQAAAASGFVHNHWEHFDPAAVHSLAPVAAAAAAGHSHQVAAAAVLEAAVAADHSQASVTGLDTHQSAEVHQLLSFTHMRLSLTLQMQGKKITTQHSDNYNSFHHIRNK